MCPAIIPYYLPTFPRDLQSTRWTDPKLASIPKPPATGIGVSPHRVWVDRGAETGETRFEGVGKGNRYLFGKDREKGGVRTAIGVRSVRVWVKRGAETPETRLRGRVGVNRV